MACSEHSSGFHIMASVCKLTPIYSTLGSWVFEVPKCKAKFTPKEVSPVQIN